MFFRLSADGKTQVNMAHVSRVCAVPCVNGIGAVAGFQIVAYTAGEGGAGRVVLKEFECKAELGSDATAQESAAAQRALDYLAGLPLTVALEGVKELNALIRPVRALMKKVAKASAAA
jgi:hypothetical protein